MSDVPKGLRYGIAVELDLFRADVERVLVTRRNEGVDVDQRADRIVKHCRAVYEGSLDKIRAANDRLGEENMRLRAELATAREAHRLELLAVVSGTTLNRLRRLERTILDVRVALAGLDESGPDDDEADAFRRGWKAAEAHFASTGERLRMELEAIAATERPRRFDAGEPS